MIGFSGKVTKKQRLVEWWNQGSKMAASWSMKRDGRGDGLVHLKQG